MRKELQLRRSQHVRRTGCCEIIKNIDWDEMQMKTKMEDKEGDTKGMERKT